MKSKLRKKGVPLRSQLQEAIVLLHAHFVLEKRAGHMLGDILKPKQRVMDILDVGRSALQAVLRKAKNDQSLRTPNQTRKKVKVVSYPDKFAKDVIARTINRKHREVSKVTLDVLHEELKDSGEFNGSRASLHRLLRTMGYTWKKPNDRLLLLEKPDIVLKRLEFLRMYSDNVTSAAPLTPVFLDETWIFQNGSSIKTWTNDSDPESIPSRLQGDGKRFIVLHAGTKYGFVPGCSLLFSTRDPKMDYHGDMDADNFLKWTTTQLLPGLEEIKNLGPFLIIMDNAPYHSRQLDKQPTTGWNKEQLKAWLERNGLAVPSTMLRKEMLLRAVQLRSNKKSYEIDTILEENGHQVLRLPPYHCQYNAIELVWAQSKQYYDKTIRDKTIHPEVTKKNDRTTILWAEALEQVTEENWANNVRHVEKEIADDTAKEIVCENRVEPMVINLEFDESSDSDIDGDLEEEDSEDDPVPFADNSNPQPSTSSFNPALPVDMEEVICLPDISFEGNVSVPIEIDSETYPIPDDDCGLWDPSFPTATSTPKRKGPE